MVRNHGVPQKIISDRDPLIVAKFWKILATPVTAQTGQDKSAVDIPAMRGIQQSQNDGTTGSAQGRLNSKGVFETHSHVKTRVLGDRESHRATERAAIHATLPAVPETLYILQVQHTNRCVRLPEGNRYLYQHTGGASALPAMPLQAHADHGAAPKDGATGPQWIQRPGLLTRYLA